MTTINLSTLIRTPVEKCFDLSRDTEIHLQSTIKTNEHVVAGRSSGLFELNDTVTWEAVHFGVKQQLTVKITKFNKPYFFEDTMLKGAFKSILHEHHFEEKNGVTEMKDIFIYETPFGIFGKLFDYFILKNYMTKFLLVRNEVIKSVAEKK